MSFFAVKINFSSIKILPHYHYDPNPFLNFSQTFLDISYFFFIQNGERNYAGRFPINIHFSFHLVFLKHDLATRTHPVPSEHHTALQLQCPREAENCCFSIVQIPEGINVLYKVTQQSYAEELDAKHFNHFSGVLLIRWKALENTECFFTCACRVPSPAELGPSWDPNNNDSSAQVKCCTSLGRCRSPQAAQVQYCDSVRRCSDVCKSVPCGTLEEQENVDFF